VYAPHHVIQDAISPTSRGTGIAINLRHELHAQTRTFRQRVVKLPNLRIHLAADIANLHKILSAAGYERSMINQQLLELIRRNKAAYGEHMRRGAKGCK
jgi:hypothetical protein